VLNNADKGLGYSIHQSAEEAPYVPTGKEEKYKTKAFIHVFVQRFAKALALGVSLGVTLVFTDFSSVHWLSVFTLPVIAAWLFAARHAGRRFAELTADIPEAS
jgi:ATP/ADP translocase